MRLFILVAFVTFADEAFDVEVFVLNAKHLSLAGLPARLARDG